MNAPIFVKLKTGTHQTMPQPFLPKIALSLVLALSAQAHSAPQESQPLTPPQPAPKMTLRRTIAVSYPGEVVFLSNSQILVDTHIDLNPQGLELWDYTSSQHLKTIALPRYLDLEMISMRLLPRSHFLATLCLSTAQDKTVRSLLAFLDIKSGKWTRIQQESERDGSFAEFDVSPDGKTVATAQLSPTDKLDPKKSGMLKKLGSRIQLWDAQSGKPLQTLRKGAFYGVHFSPDGQRLLAVGSTDALIIDLRTRAEIRLPDVNSQVAMRFSPDGQTVAVVDQGDEESGGTLRWFDAKTGRLRRRVLLKWSHSVAAQVSDLCYSQDGETLMVAGGNRSYYESESKPEMIPARGEVLFYGATDGKLRSSRVISELGEVSALAISDDGTTLATVQSGINEGGAVRIWRLE